MERYPVAKLGDIAAGERRLVTVKGQEVCLFNIEGEFFAVANRCPHAGAPLCKGQLVGLMEADGPGRYIYSRQGEILRCPWHGWEFDIRTGKSCVDPERLRIRRYEVSLARTEEVADEVVATIFPVTVEDSVIVIHA